MVGVKFFKQNSKNIIILYIDLINKKSVNINNN